MFWTKERGVELRRLFEMGLSAGVIASRMGGLTRSAVLGKLHRLRLARGAVKPIQRVAPKPRLRIVHSEPVRPVMAEARATSALARQLAEIAEGSAPRLNAPHVLKTILDLKPDDCRFPFGDPRDESFGFCGRPRVLGGSYCEGHARECFLVPQIQRKGGVFVFSARRVAGASNAPATARPRATEDVS